MQTIDKKVIGVVLAGGRSSRMGKDKALLKIEATPMIIRTQSVLLSTSVDEVVISLNDGGPQHFEDIIAEKGPLSGIHSIAMRFPMHNLLILPVDLPLIDAETLERLIECGKQSGTNVRYQHDNLPLFIQNTPQFRQVIDETLKGTQSFSVARLCKYFALTQLQNPFQSKMFNTNTPQQWRLALQHFAPKHPECTSEVIHESFK